MKTSYKLKFGKRADKEWRALDEGIRRQLQKKLARVLQNPHVPSMRLHGWKDSYRIKLRRAGVRLGYRVFDDQLIVFVIAIGPRDKDEVYDDFDARYDEGF